MVGNDASIAEDWLLLLLPLCHHPRLLGPQNRSNLAHRPWHSTLPVLRGEACGVVMSEGEGDGVLSMEYNVPVGIVDGVCDDLVKP